MIINDTVVKKTEIYYQDIKDDIHFASYLHIDATGMIFELTNPIHIESFYTLNLCNYPN